MAGPTMRRSKLLSSDSTIYEKEGRLTLYLGGFKDDVVELAAATGHSINAYVRRALKLRVQADKRAIKREEKEK
jgi:hypothetical protein